MNKAELYLARRKQEKRVWNAFITAILQMIAAASIACYIYFVKKEAGNVGLVFAGPCFIFGLIDIGRGLFAKYQFKKTREKEMVYEVMND